MPDRRIQCLHCAKDVVISERVVSTRCPHCLKRILVEDFIVTSHHALANIKTCGSLSVTTTGRVWTSVKVCDLHVQGTINGNVSAQGKVTIEPAAQVVGDVDAHGLEVKPGATLKGFYRIGPSNNSQTE